MNVYEREFRGRTVRGFQSEATFTDLGGLIRDYNIGSVIELGPYVGMSTCYFAEWGLNVLTIDHFDVRRQDYARPYYEKHDITDQYREFILNTLAYPNIRHLKMSWEQAVTLPLSADMVYIDGVHSTYSETVGDWMDKAGVLICGDDAYETPVAQAIEDHGAQTRHLGRVWWKAL